MKPWCEKGLRMTKTAIQTDTETQLGCQRGAHDEQSLRNETTATTGVWDQD